MEHKNLDMFWTHVRPIYKIRKGELVLEEIEICIN